MAHSHLLFLGTYTRNTTSKGIYALELDGSTGALSTPRAVAETPDPAWITLTPDRRFLYAIHPSTGQAIGFAVDRSTGALRPLANNPTTSSPAQPPSHLAVDATGRVLLSANYRDGYVSAIPIHDDGTLGAPNSVRHEGRGPHPTRQDKAHVHSVTLSPDNRHVVVADLGLDKLFTYAVDLAAAKLTPATPAYVATAPGAGPRHFKFSADGRHAYCINELANTITAYRASAADGALTPLQTVPTLPPDYADAAKNTTAEIRIHPNGRFLYGSNRGHDSIAVFAVNTATGLLSPAPLQLIPSGGKNPRNFALSPDGRWLVCGHQDTELVTVFSVDAATGQLTRTAHSSAVPSVVCVLFA
jgi:6-phosphogluconolactonase